jgi:hypothetical protein
MREFRPRSNVDICFAENDVRIVESKNLGAQAER